LQTSQKVQLMNGIRNIKNDRGNIHGMRGEMRYE
jgi:hypothetical protein